MNNKLSELSKPAWIVGEKEIADFMSGDEALLVRGHDPESTEPALRMYSQEYVYGLLAERDAFEGAALALLDELREVRAELEAKDKRIAELSRLLAHNIERAESAEKLLEDRLEKWQELASNQVIKINELQDKLATPVRLPDVLFIKVSGSAVPVMHAERVKERLRSAGFKCVGDE